MAEEKKAGQPASSYAGTDITNRFNRRDNYLSDLLNVPRSFGSGKNKDDGEKEYNDIEYLVEKTRLMFKDSRTDILIGLIYAVCFLHMCTIFFKFIYALCVMDVSLIRVNYILWIPFLVIPFFTWLYSTHRDFYNYKRRKLATFLFCVINGCIFTLNAVSDFAKCLLIPLALKIPLSIFIDETTVIELFRLCAIILSALPCICMIGAVYRFFDDPSILEPILSFRINHHYDFRKNTKYAYDMCVVRDLETGRMHPIKQQDRTLHTLIDGTTGTGKTSSIMSVAIANDFDQQTINLNYLKKNFMQMLQNGELTLNKDITDDEFDMAAFTPASKLSESKYKKLLKTAPLAGTTVLAPNASLADDVYELAIKRNIKVNRVDPVLLDDGSHKEGFIGFNPLVISPKLSPLFRNLEITKKARMCADVLQALYEMQGKGDPYFTSLNRNVTTCLIILILLTYDSLHLRYPQDARFENKYPTLIILQDILYDFSKAGIYLKELDYLTNTYSEDELGYKKRDYQFVIDLVNNDLLGAGAEKMFDQARGLRTLIDEFLSNPLYRQVLCCQHSVDMDEILAQNQITVVNYALELGRSDAVAFGLFFALSFNNAVLRRPEKTRTPHFFYIDEFPVLLHPSMEECFTLFRQYGVAMCVAIQTLDQMNRTEITKYLRGVLQGNCATQFIFGRISTTEMELYEKLGGKTKETVEQMTVSETSLSQADTSLSYSSRTSLQDVNMVDGGVMRSLQFQEVTVFTVNMGSPVPPFYGKVSFLKSYKRLKRKPVLYNWQMYYKETGNDRASEPSMPDTAVFTSGRSSVHLHDSGKEPTTVFASSMPFTSGRSSVSICYGNAKAESDVYAEDSTESDVAAGSLPDNLKDDEVPEEQIITVTGDDDTCEEPENDDEYVYF